MPPQPWERPTAPTVQKDHEKRILALERRNNRGYYRADAFLEDDTAEVLFDGIPASVGAVRIVWLAWTTDPDLTDYGLGLINFNDTYDTFSAEYDWNLSLQNQAGPVGSNDDSVTDQGGAFGYLNGNNGGGWGTIEIPAFGFDFPTGGPTGPMWTALGGWSKATSTQIVDSYTIAGFKEEDDEAITSITLSVRELATPANAQSFAAGSRFTLLGF